MKTYRFSLVATLVSTTDPDVLEGPTLLGSLEARGEDITAASAALATAAHEASTRTHSYLGQTLDAQLHAKADDAIRAYGRLVAQGAAAPEASIVLGTAEILRRVAMLPDVIAQKPRNPAVLWLDDRVQLQVPVPLTLMHQGAPLKFLTFRLDATDTPELVERHVAGMIAHLRGGGSLLAYSFAP